MSRRKKDVKVDIIRQKVIIIIKSTSSRIRGADLSEEYNLNNLAKISQHTKNVTINT